MYFVCTILISFFSETNIIIININFVVLGDYDAHRAIAVFGYSKAAW